MADIETGKRRWLRPLLIASLALNLAFVGAIAGFALIGGRHDKDERAARGAEGMPYIRALSDEGQRKMRDALRRDFRDHRESRGQVTEGYRAALEALRAEPFDRAALMDVLKQQSARARERFLGGQRVMIDFVANMTPDERAAYADRLSEQIDQLEKRWRSLDRD
ncbi:periplasmic heavy metal sensor [Puniceibacterium sediminis]|uniref:Uncharacterized membrane protein n=1 Tax=Puniceibacterium sediminis TaxID=1608407 RepID=A0A238Y1Z6_9RHOB|nr:periplasmic heavy metal sensor [Puniceibacterium sediminis]SNR64673.1 Uncharacterized membrane protein [Puniceibacterium sediminis]